MYDLLIVLIIIICCILTDIILSLKKEKKKTSHYVSFQLYISHYIPLFNILHFVQLIRTLYCR